MSVKSVIMNRIAALVVAMFATCTLSAQTTPRQWLDALSRTLGQEHSSHISVSYNGDNTAGESVSGYYIVDGDSYYITLGEMEVYSDGQLRYEVNNERREVVEDVVDLEACDLLTNPTRAFDFVGDEFDVEFSRGETYSEDGSTGYVGLVLTPKDETLGYSQIGLVLRRTSQGEWLPMSLTYLYDGDRVVVAFVGGVVSAMPTWRRSNYRDYDIVSFL